MRYFLHIAFHGAQYHGWQKQLGFISVQEALEGVLRKVLKEKVFLVGCGRTDAGVHASQYFLHIDVAEPIEPIKLERINLCLPPDIALFDLIPVEDAQHARFDANARTYDYFGHIQKDTLLHGISAFYPQHAKGLDFERMQQAVALLPQYREYRGFCRSPDKHEHTRCTVTHAQLYVNARGDRFRFQITASRFLKAMVRITVRRLLDIGSGRFTVEEFENQLQTGEGPILGTIAYPQGLYLSKVTYPFLEMPAKGEMIRILQGEKVNEWIAV